jgi:hypothetical protein
MVVRKLKSLRTPVPYADTRFIIRLLVNLVDKQDNAVKGTQITVCTSQNTPRAVSARLFVVSLIIFKSRLLLQQGRAGYWLIDETKYT